MVDAPPHNVAVLDVVPDPNVTFDPTGGGGGGGPDEPDFFGDPSRRYIRHRYSASVGRRRNPAAETPPKPVAETTSPKPRRRNPPKPRRRNHPTVNGVAR